LGWRPTRGGPTTLGRGGVKVPKEADLISMIMTAPNVVRVTFLQEARSSDGGLDRFYALLVKLSDVAIRYESFCIRVYNKGQANEEAYFRDGVPSVLAAPPPPTPTFLDELRAELGRIREQLNAVRVGVTRVDNEQGFAVIEAWSKPADKMVADRYFVYKDEAGKWVVEPTT
jgi:hypothetical protein